METWIFTVKDFWFVAAGFFALGAGTAAAIIANFSGR